jgi:ATP-binding cassette, subfamily B, bacterial
VKNTSFTRFLHLIQYARPYWRLVVAQFLLMAISIFFGLLKPWPMKVIVDNVIGDIPLSLGGTALSWAWSTLLFAAVVAYLLFHCGESLVQIASGTVATLTSSRMIRDLRLAVLKKVQELSIRFHDNHKVGDLVHRVTYNTTAVETAFQSGFMGVVKSSVTLVAMFGIMMIMSPLLTMIALVVVPFLMLSIRVYAKRIQKVSLEHQNQEGKVASILQEILSSIRLIKAYNREDLEHRKFSEISTASIATRLRNTVVQNSFGFATALILAAGTALMFWAGVQQVKVGTLTLGQFLVFVSYLAMLYAPLSVLSYTSSSVQGALGGANRLFEILESDDEIGESSCPSDVTDLKEAIIFKGVYFGYDADKPVLSGLELKFHRGETVAIVGETGGGKSTLLNLLMRFYDPSEGTIDWDGKDYREISKKSLRSMIAYVPQDLSLLSASLRENIAFGRPEATTSEIEEAARKAMIHDFIAGSRNGYDTEVGERGVRLSAGQRQRIAIARALVKKARVNLLDEPTSALDVETESRIMESLSRIDGQTTIIVAHRLSTVRFADRILVISRGQIVEDGTHEELIMADGPYAHLWSTQAEQYDPSKKREKT